MQLFRTWKVIGAFAATVLCALPVEAGSETVLAFSEINGPNVKLYGTNDDLVDGMGILVESIPSTPPYDIIANNPALSTTLGQPFGPLAKNASLSTLDYYDGVFDADFIAIGSGPGTAARVQVWRNTRNDNLRSERDAFVKIIDEPIDDFGVGYTGGLNVAIGRFHTNSDEILTLAVAPRTGAPLVALYGLDVIVGATALFTYEPDGADHVFNAYPEVPAGYNGGAKVAALDVDHYSADSLAEHQLVTAPGKGFKSWIKIWNLEDADTYVAAFGPYVLYEFLAFPASYKGGVNLMADTDRDFFGHSDNEDYSTIVCGQAAGGAIKTFIIDNSHSELHIGSTSYPFGKSFLGGIHLTACERNLNGENEELCVTAGDANRGAKFFQLPIVIGDLHQFEPKALPVLLPLYTFKPGAPFKATSRYRGAV